MLLQILDLYEKYYQELQRSEVLAVRDELMSQSVHFSDAVKYGMPFILYKGKNFCYFWRDKKGKRPYIGFVKGKHLEYASLHSGDRNTIKILYFDPEDDLPIRALQEVVALQMELY